jgi:hypothetical protein
MKIALALLHLDRPSRSMPEPMAKDSNARCEFPLKVSPFFFEDVIMQMCLGSSPNGSFSSAEVQVIRFNRPRDWGNHIAMQASQFAFNVGVERIWGRGSVHRSKAAFILQVDPRESCPGRHRVLRESRLADRDRRSESQHPTYVPLPPTGDIHRGY